jgi:hypothetical protein
MLDLDHHMPADVERGAEFVRHGLAQARACRAARDEFAVDQSRQAERTQRGPAPSLKADNGELRRERAFRFSPEVDLAGAIGGPAALRDDALEPELARGSQGRGAVAADFLGELQGRRGTAQQAGEPRSPFLDRFDLSLQHYKEKPDGLRGLVERYEDISLGDSFKSFQPVEAI